MKKAIQKCIKNEKNNSKEKYLFHLQKFVDFAENIEDADLKVRLIAEMMRCNEAIIEMIEKENTILKQGL